MTGDLLSIAHPDPAVWRPREALWHLQAGAADQSVLLVANVLLDVLHHLGGAFRVRFLDFPFLCE